MKKVLFDTNIILDIALKREPHFEHVFQLFSLIDNKIIEGNITASTITDIYYISKKENGHDASIQFIRHLMEIVDVLGVDKDVILKSLESGMKDFEDAIQVSAAEFNGIEIVLTRNKKDFVGSLVKVHTPQEFLNQLL